MIYKNPKIIILFIVFFRFAFPVQSQENVIVPDSVWESPKKVILYGKEQAALGNHKIIESIESDIRFQEFGVEAKFNFYDQTQLGFFKRQDFDNAKKYELKAIQFAKDNNREDLNFSGETYANHNYYWVACYNYTMKDLIAQHIIAYVI